VVGIRRRQVALEQLSGDEALLAGPANRRVRQDVDDRQVEPRFQRLQLLTEGTESTYLAKRSLCFARS